MTLKVLKVEDVAERLGNSPPTISRWCEESRQGRNDFPLPFSQRGRRRLWTADAIEEWIARRQSAPPESNISTLWQAKAEAKQRKKATESGLERHGLGRIGGVEGTSK